MVEVFQMEGMLEVLTERFDKFCEVGEASRTNVFKVENGEAIWAQGCGVGGFRNGLLYHVGIERG